MNPGALRGKDKLPEHCKLIETDNGKSGEDDQKRPSIFIEDVGLGRII
jgi:hypothetical protein